ncbi:MAG: hypothetical protein QM744_13510 [Mesorhizobium sp.]
MNVNVSQGDVAAAADAASLQVPATSHAQQADIRFWTQAILLAAGQIGVRCSPELVNNAAAWAASADRDQAIIDVAYAAGLSADFVQIKPGKINAEMLPALVEIEASHVGVVIAIADEILQVSFAVGDSFIERKIPVKNLARKGSVGCL